MPLCDICTGFLRPSRIDHQAMSEIGLDAAAAERRRVEALRRYEILDTPPDGNFDRVTVLAATALNTPIAIVSLVDADRIWLKSQVGLGDIIELPRDDGLCASAIVAPDVYIVEDARRDPRALANPLVAGDLGLRFYAAAPLNTSDGYRLGTIAVIDTKPRTLNESEKAILEDLAAIVMDEMELRLAARRAVAAERQRLDAVTAAGQRAARQAQEQRQLLEQIARDRPLGELLEDLARALEELSPGSLASVLLIDDTGERLRVVAAPNLPDFYNTAIDGTPIGPRSGSCGTAAFRRAPVVAADIATSPLWTDFREVAALAGLAACWSVPILSGDRLLGTFASYHRTPTNPTEDDVALANDFARTAALAIERHRAEAGRSRALAAEQAARREAEESRAKIESLQRATAAFGSALTSREIIDLTVEQALAGMDADAVWAVIADGPGRALATSAVVARMPGALARATDVVLADDAPLTVAVRGRQPLWYSSREPLFARFPLIASLNPDAGAAAVLPVSEGERVLGAVTVFFDKPRQFSRSDRQYLGALARLCGQALWRAGRYDVEHGIASGLQHSLLSAPPSLPWLQVAVRYRPATRVAEVGGDWYDAFVLPDGDLALVIGDVMGHDAHAAATMGQVRSMVRALACDTGAGPAHVLSRLDRLNNSLDVTLFTSLVLGRAQADADGIVWRWSNAGHPPGLLLTASGDARLLDEPCDAVIGTGRTYERADAVEWLAPGTTVLLYTDGLVETPTTVLDDRIAALLEHARSKATSPLEELCDHVFDGFPAAGDDDIAILAFRVP